MKNVQNKSESIAVGFYKQLGAEAFKSFTSTKRTLSDLAYITKLLNKKDNILDIACGYGRITIPLYESGYFIQGVDIAANLLSDARKTTKKLQLPIKFKVGSMLNLPYKNESFDKVLCFWTSFNHLLTPKDQLRAINQMYRVLKPGGIAYIDIVDGEKKSIVKKLNDNGSGHNKRVLTSTPNGVKNFDYQHTRESMKDICSRSSFYRFAVGFKVISRKRRIFAVLCK